MLAHACGCPDLSYTLNHTLQSKQQLLIAKFLTSKVETDSSLITCRATSSPIERSRDTNITSNTKKLPLNNPSDSVPQHRLHVFSFAPWPSYRWMPILTDRVGFWNMYKSTISCEYLNWYQLVETSEISGLRRMDEPSIESRKCLCWFRFFLQGATRPWASKLHMQGAWRQAVLCALNWYQLVVAAPCMSQPRSHHGNIQATCAW